MSNRRSSSHAERGARAQRRGPWPWLLAAGPAAVVIASLATAWLAFTREDGVVAKDYYKLGLMVNRTIAASAPALRDPGATIDIGAGGDLIVRVLYAAPPAHLRLSLRRPGERDDAHTLELRPGADGDWIGSVRDVGPGRRIVTLESESWRLPITVVDGLPAQIRLGAADVRS